MNEKIYEFDAEIKKVPDIDGAYIDGLLFRQQSLHWS